MTHSKPSLVRIILVPYLILFVLFATFSATGSLWLYFKAREAQSQLIVHGLLKTVKPLVEHISHSDINSLASDENSWIHVELDNLFSTIPDLKQVTLRSANDGFIKSHDTAQNLITKQIKGIDFTDNVQHLDLGSLTAPSRLHSEKTPLLRIEFQLKQGTGDSATLEFGFNRATLHEAVGRAMAMLINTITLFSITGCLFLAIAFAVTLWAVKKSRQLEIHIQELYRHATAAELMAGLVHDLRNPLASFRANIASLRISADDHEKILLDMDNDIVQLNDKLGYMLDLTRKREEPVSIVDMDTFLTSVCRLAEPVCDRHGVETKICCQVDEPVELMEILMRDVLLNMITNSAESGQSAGFIEVNARLKNRGATLILEVRDRGCGLPEKTDIFKAFVTTKKEGHGLGLAISKHTVEAHGGKITAEERDGGGVVITVSIPQPVVRKDI